MFVITRNGKTTVYTGWRAWLFMAVSLVVAWGLLALFVAAFVGMAITVGLLMLLLLPAAIFVLLLSGLLGRRS